MHRIKHDLNKTFINANQSKLTACRSNKISDCLDQNHITFRSDLNELICCKIKFDSIYV